jgi:DNA-binding beta-propeller fold protein YncE
MKLSGVSRLAMCLALLLLGSLAGARSPEGGYHLLKKYALGASEGGGREYFDYITVDSSARRVYLSHETEVKVIDADNGTVIGNITGLRSDHGVAVVQEFGRGFISDGPGEVPGRVIIFDLKTLKVIGEVKTDPNTDCIVYDPASKRIFAMNGDSHSSTVIDAKSGNVVGHIALGGAPEFAVADGKGTVYNNLEDTSELVAIDSSTLKIKSRWPLAPAGAPTALAMDRQHRRLFSSGRKTKTLVVMDADNGKIMQSLPLTAGADASVYEPETGLLFVSTRVGMIHIFHEDSPDKLSVVETVKTEFGAKTMGLDTKTHNVFVDTSDFDPVPEPDSGWGHSVVGTFRLLVYGR